MLAKIRLGEIGAIAWCMLLALPGCAEPSADDGFPTETTTTSWVAPATDSGPEDAEVEQPRFMQLTQCTSFSGSTLPIPGEVAPGRAPEGWTTNPLVSPVAYVSYSGYECQRLSLGPYERGPVHLVFEGHTRADVPPECDGLSDDPAYQEILHLLLVDDEELALFLSSVYDLPAAFAEVDVSVLASGPVAQHTWTWTPAGEESSSLTFLVDGGGKDELRGERYFWQRGQGIGLLELRHDREGPLLTDRLGQGTMNEPMLLASFGEGLFAGPMSFSPEHPSEGTFSLFSDLYCEYPET